MVATGQTNLETGSVFQSSFHMPQAAGALGVKKKKVANVEGVTKALGTEEGLGLQKRQKKGVKRLH